MSKKSRMLKAAGKAPRWLRDVAAIKFSPHEHAAHKARKLGTFGAASPVRVIDPKDYEK